MLSHHVWRMLHLWVLEMLLGRKDHRGRGPVTVADHLKHLSTNGVPRLCVHELTGMSRVGLLRWVVSVARGVDEHHILMTIR
jgi:hypothetical protein